MSTVKKAKKKACKNCKWLVKVREDSLDKNKYFCLHKKSRWCNDDGKFQCLTSLTYTHCKQFEERIDELSHIPTIILNFFDEYEELLNTKTQKMEREAEKYKRMVDKIRNMVGIKVSNIEKEVSKNSGKKDDIERLIRSRDWYRYHYKDLEKNYNGVCKAVFDLGYTIVNDGKSGIEKDKDD